MRVDGVLTDMLLGDCIIINNTLGVDGDQVSSFFESVNYWLLKFKCSWGCASLPNTLSNTGYKPNAFPNREDTNKDRKSYKYVLIYLKHLI